MRSAKSTSTMLPTEANIEKPTCALDRPVEHAGAQRAALRDERDVAGSGVMLRKEALSPTVGRMMPRQFGPTTRIGLVAQDLADARSRRAPSLPVSRSRPTRRWRRARRLPRTARARRARSPPASRRSRGRSRLGHVADARNALQAEDGLVARVDREHRTTGRGHQVVHDGPADRALGLSGADHGDRLWVEHSAHDYQLPTAGFATWEYHSRRCRAP